MRKVPDQSTLYACTHILLYIVIYFMSHPQLAPKTEHFENLYQALCCRIGNKSCRLQCSCRKLPVTFTHFFPAQDRNNVKNNGCNFPAMYAALPVLFFIFYYLDGSISKWPQAYAGHPDIRMHVNMSVQDEHN